MKKTFALALAVALVVTLASGAFAANDQYAIWQIDPAGNGPRKFSTDSNWVKAATGETINYGNTVYYELIGETFAGGVTAARTVGPVEKYDAVNGVRINQKWDIGGDWVSKVELVKRKFEGGLGIGGYEYFLAVTFKPSATMTTITDVIGEISLRRTTGNNKINRDAANPTGGGSGETNTLLVAVELKYSAPAAGNITTTSGVVTDGNRKFDFGSGDEEFELTFADWGSATFVVNTIGQGDLVLKADAKYNATVGTLYPQANLDFFNGNGVSFNKTGEMFIPADEGSFIYELKNGVLVAIPGAVYDEYDEGFYFRTRTLGTFVISDVELDLTAPDVVAPVPEAPVVVNPGTGAAA